MPNSSNADAIRRRVNGWRAAEAREFEERRKQPALDPDASLAAAMELCELLPNDLTEDVVRQREVEHTRRVWARLRARMACRIDSPQL